MAALLVEFINRPDEPAARVLNMTSTQEIDYQPSAVPPMTEAQTVRLRLATQSDEPEFLRLFELMAIETGIEDTNPDKIAVQFDRALRRDRSALIVIGKPGHLRGFCLFGYVNPWFGDGSRMPLSMFVQHEHDSIQSRPSAVEVVRPPCKQARGIAGYAYERLISLARRAGTKTRRWLQPTRRAKEFSWKWIDRKATVVNR
jgi:hypothetical protein